MKFTKLKITLLIVLIGIVRNGFIPIISGTYQQELTKIAKFNNNIKNIKELSSPSTNFTRYFTDNPDDFPGESQIHVIYVIPADGIDEKLDIDGSINTSVYAFEKWLTIQTNGKFLRLDNYNGILDISFYQLSRTDAVMRNYGAFVVSQIENELVQNGFDDNNKKYAIYYGGGSDYACGGAAWPPSVSGRAAAMYLNAEPAGYSVPCSSQQLTTSIDFPQYWEFAMLHDLLHTLGFVSSDARNYAFSYPAHVNDSPEDLMYTGTEPWTPAVLDFNNDDYYDHNDQNRIDLADSSFLTSSPIPFIPLKTNTSLPQYLYILIPSLLICGIIYVVMKRLKAREKTTNLE